VTAHSERLVGPGQFKLERRCLDAIYDGRGTGRFRWDHLSKEEKTHLGSRFRVELAREYQLADGDGFDFRLGDAPFNLAFAITPGRWLIPASGENAPCLLITGSEDSSVISAGVLRAEPELLGAPNRDGRRAFTAAETLPPEPGDGFNLRLFTPGDGRRSTT
jgi:hypothetical protein